MSGAGEGDWRSAAEVFDEWARLGKDAGMEKGHAASVEEMLSAALSMVSSLGDRFSSLDVGCGNGWVVRTLAAHPHCSRAVGIDAAPAMIEKAKEIDHQGEYHLTDLMEWQPDEGFDLIHSMETLYYLDDPGAGIRRIASWLNEGGVLVLGVDHYLENPESHDWPKSVRTRMTTMSTSEWQDAVKAAGLTVEKTWQAAPSSDWPGTLVILATKSHSTGI